MKLRPKVIALIVCLFAVLGIAQLLVLTGTLLPSFAELEQQSAATDMRRVTHALDTDLEQIAITTRDWGNWRDTYRFMSGMNDGYVEANLSAEAIATLRLNALAFFDLDGNIVWPTAADAGPAGSDLIPPGELPLPAPWREALRKGERVSGMLSTSRGPLLVALGPVLDGSGTGDHRGMVLMGRLLTPKALSAIGRQAHVDVSMLPPGDLKLPATERSRAVEVSRNTLLVERHDSTAVFKVFEDAGGKPLLTLAIEVPRNISAHGRQAVTYSSVFLLFAGAAALVLLIIMLKRAVLDPVTNLTAHAREIGSTGKRTATLDLERPDELGDLAREFDRMVRHLGDAKAQAEVQAQRAQAASQAKTDFLAMMSHEIRTPMNGVLGCVSLLMDTPLRPDQQELAQTIRSSADNLLTILNDILDYSKIEAGRMTIEETVFDLRASCEDVHRLLQQTAVQRGLTLKLDFAADIPPLITGDPVRIRQILLNLVSNAIKFTKQGGVCIEVSRSGVAHVRMSVKDTGIGISEAQLGKLFQHFTQADSSTTRRYGGTGLGLAICKRLVELMGGEIGATSVPGGGSSFFFVVPLLAAPAGSEPSGSVPALCLSSVSVPLDAPVAKASPAQVFTQAATTARRVLVVEDNVINQRVAQHMLSKMGCSVDIANNGREALTRLSEQRYELVLMDCQMPEMDGLEATMRIRDATSTVLDHAVPVVAMTANAFAEDRERCLAAGMNDFLSKPVDRKALGDIVDKWAPRPAGAQGYAATGGERA
jgi:signal transduction histidine kinase/ActR/RegA family two-component response regulator